MTEIMKPFISVLIPTYNRVSLVVEAVGSALAQDYSGLEVIVVDDGSTDDTTSRLALIRDKRFRYVSKTNSGVAATRNRAIVEAQGDYIVWLDSDDILLPHAVSTFVSVIANNPGVDILYGHLIVTDRKGNETGRLISKDYRANALIQELVYSSVIQHAGTCVRKQCYACVGGYDPQLKYAEDYDFFSRAADVCVFKSIPDFLCLYRQHGPQLCGYSNTRDKSLECEVVLRMVARYGFKRLFPDLFSINTEAAGTASFFRLVRVFNERRSGQETMKAFRVAMSAIRNAGKLDELVLSEVKNFLYEVAVSDCGEYRYYAWSCLRSMPGDMVGWKHVLFSLFPNSIRGAVFRMRDR